MPRSILIKHVYQKPDDEGASSTGGTPDFDIDSAMEAVHSELQSEGNAPAPAPAPSPSPTPSPAPSPRAYPKSWKPDHQALWESLPESHQQLKDLILGREDDFHRGLEQYKQNAALGDRLNRVLTPYQQVFQQHNVDPQTVDSMLGSLLNAQMTLALGTPEQRAQLVKGLIDQYQLTPDALGLGASTGAPNAELTALQNKIRELESALNGQQSYLQSRTQAEIRAEVEAFARANPLFNDVQSEIALLIKANPEETLQSAYEKAIWMNPAAREKHLAEKQAADVAAKAERDRKAAEEAARASRGSVKTPGRSAADTAPLASMDDTMREALANIKKRQG